MSLFNADVLTLTLNKAQADFATLVELAINKHSQFRIASEQSGVILISEEDYENLLETLELLSQPGFYDSTQQVDQEIETGDTLSWDKVFGGE